jgi:hypothetical protein
MTASQYGFRGQRKRCLLPGVSVRCEPQRGTPGHIHPSQSGFGGRELWDSRPRPPKFQFTPEPALTPAKAIPFRSVKKSHRLYFRSGSTKMPRTAPAQAATSARTKNEVDSPRIPIRTPKRTMPQMKRAICAGGTFGASLLVVTRVSPARDMMR